MNDFGERNSSLNVSQSSSTELVPSRELSDVIVNAFSSAFNQFNTQNNTNNISGNLTGGLADQSIAEYYENLLRQSLEKEEKQKKKDAEERKKKEDAQRKIEFAEYRKNAQTIMNEMSTWANNPLQGVSDVIDAGFKKVFTGLQAAWNKPIVEIGPDLKKTAKTIFSPVTKTASFISEPFKQIGMAGFGLVQALTEKKQDLDKSEIDMDSLISEEVGINQSTVKQPSSAQVAQMDSLISEESSVSKVSASQELSKSEKDATKNQLIQKNKDDKENSEKQIKATSGVGLTVGGLFTQYVLPIVLGITALAALAPVIITELKLNWRNMKEIGIPLLLRNIGDFFRKLGIDLEVKAKEILSKVKIKGVSIFNAGDELTEELKAEQRNKQREIEEHKLRIERSVPRFRGNVESAGFNAKEQQSIYDLVSNKVKLQQLPTTSPEALRLRSEIASTEDKFKNDPRFEKIKVESEKIEKILQKKSKLDTDLSRIESQLRFSQEKALDVLKTRAESQKQKIDQENQDYQLKLYSDVSQKDIEGFVNATRSARANLDEPHKVQFYQNLREGKTEKELMDATQDKGPMSISRGLEYEKTVTNVFNDIKNNFVGSGSRSPVAAR